MTDTDKLLPLLIPYQGMGLESYPVSKAVNGPKINDSRCIERIS